MRDGGSADILIGFVHLDQQHDIVQRIFAGKGHHRRTIALGQRNLGQAVALAAPRVVEPLENPADVPLPFVVVPGRRKHDGRASAEKFFDLFNRANPLFVHVDHHPQDDQPTCSSPPASSLQTHSSSEIQASFWRISHWTRLPLASCNSLN